MIWQCGRYSFDTQMPIVMGVLNVTPDSFSDGGEHFAYDAALTAGRAMHEAGALVIDVGGESTRPGAEPVAIEEELARTVDVVGALASEGICVSIDTRHPEVARAAVDAGAAIINDVSGFRDPLMVKVAGTCDVGVIVMHMKGEPATMQREATYGDIVVEVRDYLVKQAEMLQRAGIAPQRIAIDPGPGFGKTPQQTIELMRNLHELVRTGYPVVAAPSRKSYVGYAYNIPNPADRDEASAQEALLACELGASIVRMHNVPVAIATLADVRPFALLGLGCNVALTANPGEERDGKIAQLNMAIGSLSMLPDSQVIDVSSFYASEPAYFEDQDEFVNAVVLMRTGLSPRDLLGYLHAIENSLGRVREIENGPRTCDIDILDYQLYSSDDEQLVLPHPRILERDFVVKPLLELLPHHILSDGTPVTADKVAVGRARKL
ncbi:dihydropteroate synthase [Curtanaerobium respiraculi]|uniref:dihydropteroate synthase n=1 Tax=Curtanaerobium respiraculi TaxID=2949669 RepID=UPI0024B3B6B8|nr:dihydropteroate synthase [Curtanaerobium respiraculi]